MRVFWQGGYIFLLRYVREAKGKATPELGLREFRWFKRQDFLEVLNCSVVQDSFTLSVWCRYVLKQLLY